MVLVQIEASSSSGDSTVVEELRDFDCANAHCFDPNEEGKIRSVIHAGGVNDFNSCIRDLASVVADSMKESKKKRSVQNDVFLEDISQIQAV